MDVSFQEVIGRSATKINILILIVIESNNCCYYNYPKNVRDSMKNVERTNVTARFYPSAERIFPVKATEGVAGKLGETERE